MAGQKINEMPDGGDAVLSSPLESEDAFGNGVKRTVAQILAPIMSDVDPEAGGSPAPGSSIYLARADHAHPQVAVETAQTFLSGSGTYTTPANARQLLVRMVASGGSGQGSGTSPGNGAAGTNTTFGSWTAVAGGAGSGLVGGSGGTGGTDHTGTVLIRQAGGRGGDSRSGYTYERGGQGGGTPLGSGLDHAPSEVSRTPAANSGVGGTGGSADATASPGAGGGGGEYVEFLINNPAGTYSYAVGGAATGGTAGTGTNPRAGGDSAAGRICVEERY